MPTRRAIAAAVRPWSPVTTMMRMPASWHAATASATSARGGSNIATSPRKQRSALGLLADARVRRRRRLEPALGDGEHAQALARRSSSTRRPSSRALAGPSGRSLSVAPDHRRAARQQRLRRALGVDPQPAVALVDRRHELEHRIEVEVPQALARSRCGEVHGRAQVAGGGEHRQLGRIAGRVAARRRRVRVVARGHRVPSRPARTARSSSGREPSPAASMSSVCGAVQIDGDLHPVLGQRAGLVGADHARRAERLDRAQALDHRAAAHQLAHADRERERDHRQQALGHVADEQPDREHDRVAKRRARRRTSRSGRTRHR